MTTTIPTATKEEIRAMLDAMISPINFSPTSFDLKKRMRLLPARGKGGSPTEYLEVLWRTLWFRELFPNGTIETQEVEVDTTNVRIKKNHKYWDDTKKGWATKDVEYIGYARFRAIVKNGNGGVATATKTEIILDFEDYVEKSETGAVGRALALLGFGTANAIELSEGEIRIVDSPVDSHHVSSTSSQSNGQSQSQGNGNGASTQGATKASVTPSATARPLPPPAPIITPTALPTAQSPRQAVEKAPVAVAVAVAEQEPVIAEPVAGNLFVVPAVVAQTDATIMLTAAKKVMLPIIADFREHLGMTESNPYTWEAYRRMAAGLSAPPSQWTVGQLAHCLSAPTQRKWFTSIMASWQSATITPIDPMYKEIQEIGEKLGMIAVVAFIKKQFPGQTLATLSNMDADELVGILHEAQLLTNLALSLGIDPNFDHLHESIGVPHLINLYRASDEEDPLALLHDYEHFLFFNLPSHQEELATAPVGFKQKVDKKYTAWKRAQGK